MNSKIDKSLLLSYLYNEMSEEDKCAFERKLVDDPILCAELAELKDARKILGTIPSFNPNEPLVLGNLNTTPFVRSRDTYWRKWASVAAALLVVLLAAVWWNVEIQWGNSELKIIFNKVQKKAIVQEKDDLDKEVERQKKMLGQISQMYLTKIEDSLYAEYSLLKSELVRSLKQKEEQDESKQDAYLGSDEIEYLIKKINEENFKNTALLVMHSTEDQQLYTRKLMKELAEYIEEKRQSDLQLVNYALRELKSNTQAQQEETNIILAKLIDEWSQERK